MNLAAVKKKITGAGCRVSGTNYGDLKTPEQCGDVAKKNGCSDFMWSGYTYWGCRCCSGQTEGGNPNTNWDVYTVLSDEDVLVEDVGKCGKLTKEQMEWVDKVAKEFAQTKQINEVVDFVNQRKDFLVQYTGNALKESMGQMAKNTRDMKQINTDIKNMAYNVKAKAEQAKRDLSGSPNWTNALTNLVGMLKIAVTDSGKISNDLDRITKDLEKTKTKISTMVMSAENEYKSKVQDL